MLAKQQKHDGPKPKLEHSYQPHSPGTRSRFSTLEMRAAQATYRLLSRKVQDSCWLHHGSETSGCLPLPAFQVDLDKSRNVTGVTSGSKSATRTRGARRI